MVEIDAGDDAKVGIFERRGVEDATVIADVGSGPVSSQIERIRDDGLVIFVRTRGRRRSHPEITKDDASVASLISYSK